MTDHFCLSVNVAILIHTLFLGYVFNVFTPNINIITVFRVFATFTSVISYAATAVAIICEVDNYLLKLVVAIIFINMTTILANAILVAVLTVRLKNLFDVAAADTINVCKTLYATGLFDNFGVVIIGMSVDIDYIATSCTFIPMVCFIVLCRIGMIFYGNFFGLNLATNATISHSTNAYACSLNGYLTLAPSMLCKITFLMTTSTYVPMTCLIVINLATRSMAFILRKLLGISVSTYALVGYLTIRYACRSLSYGAFVKFVRNLLAVTATSTTLEPVIELVVLIFCVIIVLTCCLCNCYKVREGCAAELMVNIIFVSTCSVTSTLKTCKLRFNCCCIRLCIILAAGIVTVNC